MSLADRWSGRACMRCGVTRALLTVVQAAPPKRLVQREGGGWDWVFDPSGDWRYARRSRCLDRAACEARVRKREDRERARHRVLVVAEPAAPDAPPGTCRWCGLVLTGRNAGRRNYCYPDREGRDCAGEFGRSRVWSARDAVARRGDPACADCGSDRPDWEADHEVALEDGGEHALENLVRRCVPCHAAKTAREATERAGRRREAASGQEQLAL